MGAPPRPRPPAPPFPQYDPTSNLCIPFQAQYYPDAYGTACANPLPGGQYGLPDLDALDAGPGRCQPGLDYVVGGGRVGLGGGWAWVVCLSATPRTPPIAFQPRCRRSPHLPSTAPSSFTPPSPLHTILFLRPTTSCFAASLDGFVAVRNATAIRFYTPTPEPMFFNKYRRDKRGVRVGLASILVCFSWARCEPRP